jgi:hypothetical protein
LPFVKGLENKAFSWHGKCHYPFDRFFRGISVKKLLFLTLIVLLALPLACDSRVFNQPVSSLIAPTSTPTPAWSYVVSNPTPTPTP